MKTNTGKISFFSAVLMSVNIMVGAGIFYAVGPMTAAAGSSSFLGWPLIGLLLFPVIWGVSKAAQLYPGEGGFYHYCSSGMNPTAGFVAHWGYLLGFIASAASLAAVLRSGLVLHTGLSVLTDHPILFNATAAIFYTLIQLLSINKISKIQSVATLLKVTPILLVIALIVAYFQPNLSFSLSALSQLGSAVPTVIFAFWGFEVCCSIGGLLKDGPQKVSSVILTGFFVTVALYSLFHIGLFYIMGAEQLAAFGAVSFPSFLGLSPSLEVALQTAVLGAILFCWANSILGMSLSNISNLYFLAKKKMIIGDQLLSKLNRNERPTYSVIAHGVILFLLLTFITDIDILFSLTNLGVLTAFALTLASVFITYVRQKKIVHVAATLLAFISCSILGYYSWIKIPNLYYTLPLIIGMLLGVIQFTLKKSQWSAAEV
ncbi:MAG: APC family permease [Rhabdochlamydiaceae bacterium]|nr:APC family permease [Rhabdochlamydiaceae bacterium]